MSIQKSIAKYFLKRIDAPKRNKKGVSFNHANLVGVVYLDQDEAFYKKVKDFLQYLKAEHGIKEVLSLAYCRQSEKHVPVYQSHKLESDYFSKSEVNWQLKPAGVANPFAEKPFDILIDFSKEESFPIQHILKASPAKMKVGMAGNAHQALYDLSIAVDPKNDIDGFITQLRYYLSKLELA